MSAQSPKISPAVLHRPILLASLGLTFLGFSLPIYAKALGASALEIGGLYSVFTVTILLVRPVTGWALDRYGRKSFLLAGLAGYAVAMALFAMTNDLSGLYLARLVNGLASALTWIATSTIVADLAAPEQRGRSMGQVNEMGARGEMIGAVIGFNLMGMLSPQTAWPLLFAGYAVLAGCSAWLSWKSVPETRPAALAAHRQSKLRLTRPFVWLLMIVFTTATSQALISPIYMVFLQDRFTTDVPTLALAFLPGGILFTFLPSRLGSLSDRFGRAPFMALGLLGSGLLFLLLPGLPDLRWLIVVYTLSAVGWTMAMPAEAALVADLTGSAERGRGYGLYQLMGSLGATVGPLVGGWLYDNAGQAVPFHWTGLLLLASAAWVYLTLRGEQSRAQSGELETGFP